MSERRFTSLIGPLLRTRRISVSELQRRLAARGVSVSRGALYRIVSDQPIETVSFPVVVPVLEQLGLTFEDAFQPAAESEIFERASDHRQAQRILASLSKTGHPTELSSEVQRELQEVIDRTGEVLKARKPELFDSRGRLRRRALAREIAQRLDGQTLASESEYVALTSPPDGWRNDLTEAPPTGG